MRTVILDGIVNVRSLFGSDLDPFQGFEGDQKLKVADLAKLGMMLKNGGSKQGSFGGKFGDTLSDFTHAVNQSPGLALVNEDRAKLVVIAASLLGYDDLIMRLEDAGLDETSIFVSNEEIVRELVKSAIAPMLGDSGTFISFLVPDSLAWLF